MFKPDEATVGSVEWNGEGHVKIETSSFVFSGAKRKDFYCPDEPWEERLKAGARVRFWCIQGSRVAGIELFDTTENEYVAMWFVGNDFQTKAERDAGAAAYGKFIEDEGQKIAGWIDEGKTLAEIDELVADGHTGNTYGCALALGIHDAKDREKANAIRTEHNGKYGVSGDKDKGGVVNPAILSVAVPDGK